VNNIAGTRLTKLCKRSMQVLETYPTTAGAIKDLAGGPRTLIGEGERNKESGLVVERASWSAGEG